MVWEYGMTPKESKEAKESRGADGKRARTLCKKKPAVVYCKWHIKGDGDEAEDGGKKGEDEDVLVCFSRLLCSPAVLACCGFLPAGLLACYAGFLHFSACWLAC